MTAQKTKPLTFKQFQRSARSVPDLSEALPDLYEQRTPARVYAGDLVIEDSGGDAEGAWVLRIENIERCSNDLPALERELYNYGRDEGHI